MRSLTQAGNGDAGRREGRKVSAPDRFLSSVVAGGGDGNAPIRTSGSHGDVGGRHEIDGVGRRAVHGTLLARR